jgi:hypothetical protein
MKAYPCHSPMLLQDLMSPTTNLRSRRKAFHSLVCWVVGCQASAGHRLASACMSNLPCSLATHSWLLPVLL